MRVRGSAGCGWTQGSLGTEEQVGGPAACPCAGAPPRAKAEPDARGPGGSTGWEPLLPAPLTLGISAPPSPLPVEGVVRVGAGEVYRADWAVGTLQGCVSGRRHMHADLRAVPM